MLAVSQSWSRLKFCTDTRGREDKIHILPVLNEWHPPSALAALCAECANASMLTHETT